MKRRIQGSNEVNNLLNKPFENQPPQQPPQNFNINSNVHQYPLSHMRTINNEVPNNALNNQGGLSQSRTVPLGSNLNINTSNLQQSS